MRLPLPNGEGLEKRAKETARDGSCLIGQLGELPNMAIQDGETAKRSAVHPDVRHPPTKGEPSGRSSVVQEQHDHGQQRGIESKPRSRRRWSAEINGGGAQR